MARYGLIVCCEGLKVLKAVNHVFPRSGILWSKIKLTPLSCQRKKAVRKLISIRRNWDSYMFLFARVKTGLFPCVDM